MRLRDLPRDPVVWLYAAIAAVFFFEPLTTGTFFFRDLYHFFFPKRLLLADALRSGAIPLWDPMTHGGQPFLATPSNTALHPSNLFYLVLSPVAAFNLVLVVHVWLAAAGAYWLARTCGLRRSGAAVAGIGFAWCGLALSTPNLMPLLLALPWIPFTIGLTHRALRDGRSIVPAAFAAAMPLYAAAVEITAMMFLTLLIWILAADYPTSRWKRVGALVLVGLMGGALSLAQTLPALSVIAQSSRGESRSYEGFSQWSVRPERLPELIVPRFLGRTDSIDEANYWGKRLESRGYPYILSLYLGVPLLLLAVAGSLSRGVGSEVPRRALALMALAAIIASIGRNLPGFRAIYDYVPLVTTFRFPVKAQLAAILPISLLAGYGVEKVLSSSRMARAAAAGAAIFALAGGLLFSLLRGTTFLTSFAAAFSFTQFGEAQALLLRQSFLHMTAVSAALALVMLLASRHRPFAATLILTIVTADLLVAGRSVNVYAPRSLFAEPAIATKVKDAASAGRFHSAPGRIVLTARSDHQMWLARYQLATLEGYTATMFGIPVAFHDDYDGLAPERNAALGKVSDRVSWPQRLALFNRAFVTAFSSRQELRAAGLRELGRINTETGPIYFYRNENARAARFVSRVERVPDQRTAFEHLLRSRSSDKAILETAPPRAGACGEASVKLVTRGERSMTYAVDAPCDGIVVLAENHYRGWQTTIDGRPMQEFPADFAFAAVAVTKGKHTIARRYTPPLLGAGVAASTTTALLLLAFSIARRARSSRGV